MRMTTFLGALTLVLLPFAGNAAGQSGGGFDLDWNTAPGGGETISFGGGFSLLSTIGQPDAVDGLSGGTFELDGGFDPGVCGSHISAYGSGCPGTGGFIPQYQVSGCIAPGYTAVTTITQGLGGSVAFIFLGLNQAALPLGGGCTLNVSPLLGGPAGPIPLLGAGAGNGSISFPTTIPPIPAIVGSFTAQVFVSDPTAPNGLGFSTSNGVRFDYGA